MNNKIIDGKAIAKKIKNEIRTKVAKLNFKPAFSDVLIGDNKASEQYVAMKKKACIDVGIEFIETKIAENKNTEFVISEIKNLSKKENISGIIVQLPLPDNFNTQEILNSVPVNLDVDAISETSKNNFYNNNVENFSGFIFPTALAILEIIKQTNYDLVGKKIVILGEGELVGKPIAHILKNQNLDVTTLNSRSENKEEIIKNADVLICAIGKAHFVKGSMIKEGVFIIDAGTSESNGAILGDVDTNSVLEIASILVPCPGGVGPITVSMLLFNILKTIQKKNYDH